MNKNDYTPREQQEILDDLFSAMEQKLVCNFDGTPICWRSLQVKSLVGKLVRVKASSGIHHSWQGQVGTVTHAVTHTVTEYNFVTLYTSRGEPQGVIFRADQLDVLR